MSYDYDMIVIGGGAAGLTAAGMSALLGAKTALIEHHRLGGDCTWTGCIPSKTLIHAAKVAHQCRNADQFGLQSVAPQFDFGELMNHIRSVREGIYDAADAPPNMEKLGVEVIDDHAEFTDAHHVQLHRAAQTLSSRFFVIATGSRPRTPGFDQPVLTNESLFELDKQPERLVILGTGPIGIEMAQAFGRLGSQVAMVDPGERILRNDDEELSRALQNMLAAEGVQFHLGRKATAWTGRRVMLDDGRAIECDAVLAAMGRLPVVDGLGLDRAGIRFDAKGIRVNTRCRTSQRHVYACGDVAGGYLFTHWAEHMSKIAVTNAILRIPAKTDASKITWCTFTHPELARVGKSESEIRDSGQQCNVFRYPFSKLDRAIAESATIGLIKVMAAGSGRVLGVSILGEHAGDMIGEWSVVIRKKLKVSDVADTLHAYPTYALGNRRVADQWYERWLDSPVVDVLGKLFRYRGTRTHGIQL